MVFTHVIDLRGHFSWMRNLGNSFMDAVKYRFSSDFFDKCVNKVIKTFSWFARSTRHHLNSRAWLARSFSRIYYAWQFVRHYHGISLRVHLLWKTCSTTWHGTPSRLTWSIWAVITVEFVTRLKQTLDSHDRRNTILVHGLDLRVHFVEFIKTQVEELM